MNPFTTQSLTNTGGRNTNQDALGFLDLKRACCWVVADGLGGHQGGEVAAKLAVDTILASFRGNQELSVAALQSHLLSAHQAIIARQRLDPRLQSMRTTAVVLISDYRSILWAHVGDSRLYYLQGGRIISQTRDHSVPQVMADAGDITQGQIRHHEDRSRLLRALGMEGGLRVAVQPEEHLLYRGDALLLCVDGFWEDVLEPEVESDLSASRGCPKQWLAAMEARINSRAAADPASEHDNYTAIAICYNNARAQTAPPAWHLDGPARTPAAGPSTHPNWILTAGMSIAAMALFFVLLGGSASWILWKNAGQTRALPEKLAAAAAPAITISNGPVKSLNLPAGWVEVNQRDDATGPGQIFMSQQFRRGGKLEMRLRLLNRLLAPSVQESMGKSLRDFLQEQPHQLSAHELKSINRLIGSSEEQSGQIVSAETRELNGKRVLAVETLQSSSGLASYSILFSEDSSGSSVQEIRFESPKAHFDRIRNEIKWMLEGISWVS